MSRFGCDQQAFPLPVFTFGDELLLLDVAVRHRTFGSGRFERTQRAHLLCSTLQDDTTALSRNVGKGIPSDALSHRRTLAPCRCVTHLLVSVGIAGDVP